MNIEQILEYQKVDMQFIRLENEVRNSEVGKKLEGYRAQQKSIVEDLLRLNQQTEELFGAYQRTASQTEEIRKEILELENSVSDDSETGDLEYYVKMLEKNMSALEAAEREALRIQKELGAMRDSAKKMYATASKAAQLSKEFKEQFDALRKEKSEEAKEILAKRKEMEPHLDAQLFAAYQKARKNGKAPFFVPMRNDCCGGCGMEANQSLKDRIAAGSAVEECPNCGRMIYSDGTK